MAGVVEMAMEYLAYLIYNIYSYGKCMHIIYGSSKLAINTDNQSQLIMKQTIHM